MPLSSHISTASGQKVLIAEGTRLVFGRGPGVDLIVAAGRGLSRRAGLVTAMAAGAWIANISRTHALYVEGDGYQVRLPRMEHDGEPANESTAAYRQKKDAYSAAWKDYHAHRRDIREATLLLVIDEADRSLAAQVEAAGITCVVAPTVMRTPAVAAALAKTVLAA